MKDIGEKFKEARLAIGIKEEEVIKDLNITQSQLENLEDGNINAFRDVFFLKDIVKKYTKYLNLDEDEIMGTFNDYIFSFTSRIPVADILEQTREIEILKSQNEESKIASPYTIKRKKPSRAKYIVLYTTVAIMIIIITLIIVKKVTDNKNVVESNMINMNERSTI